MEHLLAHITGIDMALCVALLILYLWQDPGDKHARGLDTEAVD